MIAPSEAGKKTNVSIKIIPQRQMDGNHLNRREFPEDMVGNKT